MFRTSAVAVIAGLVPASIAWAETVSDNGGLQEITVTAQRRASSIQDTPLAITALSGADLADQGVVSMSTLQGAVPGLSIAEAGAGTVLYMRGVGNFSTSQFAETAIAINYDGAYIGRPTGLNGFFYDIDRIEVLKGPQGTLYGRNASGGAINIITNAPNFAGYSGNASLEVGDYNLIKTTAAVNIPINDVLALRAAGQVISRSGYLTDGYSDDKEQDGRIQALFKPSDDVSLKIGIDYSHLGGKGASNVIKTSTGSYLDPDNPWLGPSSTAANTYLSSQPGIPFINPINNGGHQNVQNLGLTLEYNQNLGFAQLTFLPAFRFLHDDSYSFTPGFYTTQLDKTNTQSLELRLASPGTTRFTWVGGAYFYNETQSGSTFVDQTVNQEFQHYPSLTTRSYALFGEGDYEFLDSWHLIAGGRYTIEDKSAHLLDSSGSGQVFLADIDLPLLNSLPPGTFTPLTSFDTSQQLTYHAFNWKGGLKYDLTADSNLYFTAATGFKSGGFYQAAPPNTFQPEKLTAYEIGWKNRFFGDRLIANLEVFDWDYRNHQEGLVTRRDGSVILTTVNAGEATIRGADLDLQAQLSAADRIGGIVEYLHTKYDSFVYTVPLPTLSVYGCPASNGPNMTLSVNCNGKSVVHAPEFAANLWYEHEFRLGRAGALTFRAETQLSSSYATAIDFTAAEVQHSYTSSNLRVSYLSPAQTWSAAAYVNNVENTAITGASLQDGFKSNTYFATIRPPRTFGLRLGYRW